MTDGAPFCAAVMKAKPDLNTPDKLHLPVMDDEIWKAQQQDAEIQSIYSSNKINK